MFLSSSPGGLLYDMYTRETEEEVKEMCSILLF